MIFGTNLGEDGPIGVAEQIDKEQPGGGPGLTEGLGLARPPAFCHRFAVGKTAKQEFSVIVERDEEGYYVASVPALPGCHTQARSLDKLVVRVREAIELCLEVDGSAPTGFEFVGVQRITV